jgi:hypothetical protein
MRGLDPRIHAAVPQLQRQMDAGLCPTKGFGLQAGQARQ